MDASLKIFVSRGHKFGVWKVTQLNLSAVPETEWGKFYSRDCYLVFVFDNRIEEPEPSHVFYWLGKDSSIDKKAVVARQSAELDNFCDGKLVVHKEMQGHESMGFKKQFESGIVTLLGGYDEFDEWIGHKPLEQVARLFHVRGGKTVALSEVELDWGSMNHGDSFVVDTGSLTFIWVGVSSSGLEKEAAAGLASKLRDKMVEEYVYVRDGEEEKMNEDELKEWNQYLPLVKKGNVKEADCDGDTKVDQILNEKIALYEISDWEQSVRLIKEGKLEHKDLNEDDAFIILGYELGIWIWLGRKCSETERKEAFRRVENFIENNDLPKDTLPKHSQVTKVNMGGEPEEFKSLFINW